MPEPYNTLMLQLKKYQCFLFVYFLKRLDYHICVNFQLTSSASVTLIWSISVVPL